jgi:hypothetical protein
MYKLSTRLYAVLSAAVLCVAFTARSAEAQFRPQPLGGGPPPAEQFWVEASAGFWSPTADMAVTSDGSGPLEGIIGSRIDFKEDLGLTDHRFRELHAVLRPARKHKLRFQFIPIKYEQEGVLERKIIFNGQAYPLGIATSSLLQWNAYRFGYEYDFVTTNRGFGGFILEAKYTDIAAELVNFQTREFVKASAPIPAIGGIARVYVVPAVSVTFELTGIAIPKIANDYDGHYADLDLYGTVNLQRNIGLQLGYRSFDVGVTVTDLTGTFLLKGLYFGMVARY